MNYVNKHSSTIFIYIIIMNLKNTKGNTKRSIKKKSLAIPIFEVDGYFLSSVVQIVFEQTMSTKNMYIISYFKYKNKSISLSKHLNVLQNKGYVYKDEGRLEKENLIRNEIIKNKNVTIKEISKSTKLSTYLVNRYYMKIRREQFSRCIL